MPKDARSAADKSDARLRLLRAVWSDVHRVAANAPRGVSTAAVHESRVAARRLRALLRSLRDEINPVAYGQLQFDLTNLGRDFATVRTADVRLRFVDELLAERARCNSNDRTSLRMLLERMATSARRSLERSMQNDAWQQRLQRIAAAFDQELLLRSIRPAAEEYRSAMACTLAETLSILRKHSTDIQVLHRQRIRIKSTRYVCALLAPHIDLDTKELQIALTDAQDILGDIHDLHATIHWLRTSSIPTPLTKPLAKQSTKQLVRMLKKFRRIRPELRRCLRKSSDTVSKQIA